MKAFAFKPTNELIGKFTIQSFDQMPAALQNFLANKDPVPIYSYVEASGRKWTIVSQNPFQLREGVVMGQATEQHPETVSGSQGSAQTPISENSQLVIMNRIRSYALVLVGVPLGYILSYFFQPGAVRMFMSLGDYVGKAQEILIAQHPEVSEHSATYQIEHSLGSAAWLGVGIGVVAMGVIANIASKKRD